MTDVAIWFVQGHGGKTLLDVALKILVTVKIFTRLKSRATNAALLVAAQVRTLARRACGVAVRACYRHEKSLQARIQI